MKRARELLPTLAATNVTGQAGMGEAITCATTTRK
jgi:hypothetical protein